MLARAVGSKVESQIRDMLEPMFSAGLSPELTSALRIISQEIPGLQREIQGWFIPSSAGLIAITRYGTFLACFQSSYVSVYIVRYTVYIVDGQCNDLTILYPY